MDRGNTDEQSERKKRPENYLILGVYCIPSNQPQSSDTHNKVDVVLSGHCHPSSMDKAAELAKSYKTSGQSDRPDKYTEACGRENMQSQQLWVDPGDISPCTQGGCPPPEHVRGRHRSRLSCH